MKSRSKLKNESIGVYPADQFPVLLPNGSFVVLMPEKIKHSEKECIVSNFAKTTNKCTDYLGCNLFLSTQTLQKRYLQSKLKKI